MTHRLMSAIANRDGSALARMSNPTTQAMQGVVNPDAENLVDALFRQLKQVFPAASQTNLRRPEDENAAKKQWIAAFAENGIRTREQLSAGMQHARSSESPFWPSPGQFIAWCKQGVLKANGLPSSEELYGLVMEYCANRGLYSSPESYPWPSNATYWMVTKLYSQMRGKNQSESELRKSCTEELVIMGRRIESGEEIPKPVVQLEKLHIPISNEAGLQKIADIRKKLNLPRRGKQ
ncbi:replication protein P [Hafnia alvei]|uniref:replication protein P n=1 Tax=Hafnia alvei TaxID=569 RepID=UPI000E03ADF4|nr:replication protein P [Hafnia alvei]STQ71488.1 Replication protein P [Hafnia alvei]